VIRDRLQASEHVVYLGRHLGHEHRFSKNCLSERIPAAVDMDRYTVPVHPTSVKGEAGR